MAEALSSQAAANKVVEIVQVPSPLKFTGSLPKSVKDARKTMGIAPQHWLVSAMATLRLETYTCFSLCRARRFPSCLSTSTLTCRERQVLKSTIMGQCGLLNHAAAGLLLHPSLQALTA